MDQIQFQQFIDKLNQIGVSIEQLVKNSEVDPKKDPKKPEYSALTGKKESRLSPGEKKIEEEKGTIYAKAFNKMLDEFEQNLKSGESKTKDLLKKNLIKVSLDRVSNNAINSLKRVFSEQQADILKQKKKEPQSGGGGGILGMLGGLMGGGGPFGVLIAAIAAIGGVAIIYMLIKNIDKIGNFLAKIIPVIGDFLVKTLPVAFESIGKFFVKIIPTLKIVFDFINNLVKNVLSGLPPIIDSIGKIVLPIIEKVVDFFKYIIANIPLVLEKFFGGVRDIVIAILDRLPAILPFVVQIGEMIRDVVLKLIDKLPEILKIISDFLLPVIKTIKDIVLELIPPLERILTLVLKKIKELAPYVKDILVAAFETLKSVINNLLDAIKPLIPYLGEALVIAANALKDAVNGVFNIFDKLIGFFERVATKVLDTVKDIFQKFSDGLKWLLDLEPTRILATAGAITTLGFAIAGFGAATLGGGVASAVGGLVGKVGGGGPTEVILSLAKNAENIDKATKGIDSLTTLLASVSEKKYGDAFKDEMTKVKEGITTLASSLSEEELSKLRKITQLKEALSKPMAEFNVKTQSIRETSSNVTEKSISSFNDLYSSTTSLDKNVVELTAVLKEIKGKFSQSIELQQKQTTLASTSVEKLQDISDKKSASSNVVVSNNNSNIVFSEKGASNLEFRRDFSNRFGTLQT